MRSERFTRIRAARLAAGYADPLKLAKRLGYRSAETILRSERPGCKVGHELASKLARLYGCNLCWFCQTATKGGLAGEGEMVRPNDDSEGAEPFGAATTGRKPHAKQRPDSDGGRGQAGKER